MSTAELKNYLHKLVVETEDDSMLEKLIGFIHSMKKNTEEDWFDSLPSPVQERLNKSIAQDDAGKVISHQEVVNQIK